MDEERVDDELMLLHTGTLEVRVLNETATVLWDALAVFDRAEDLASLISEARPEIDDQESLAYALEFLKDLASVGFVELESDCD